MENANLSWQIAELLNERNKLESEYTMEMVSNEFENYVSIVINDKLIACGETRKVQWYQWEILHVSVKQSEEGKGYASKVLKQVEEKAVREGAQVLQCTIRADNESSIRLFEAKEYKRVNSFLNVLSGRWLYIYQKVVAS